MTTIDSFPNDNIERVVYLYNCIKLNTNSESDNILAEILLVEIDKKNPNRLKISNDSYGKYDVTFRDLDTVQIGSLWRGQTLVEGRKFTFNNCLQSVTFEFNFSINKPQIIRFDDKIPDTKEHYLFNEKIFIPKNEYDKVPSKFYPLLMSKYCLLKTNDNVEVLTNCIHALHAFYIPARKDIRGHLVNDNYSLSHIVDLFFENYKIQNGENGEILVIKLKENAIKSIGKEAITFLANLALNKNTQEAVLKIRQSLNDIKLDKNGRPYPTRFPSVIPPHSTKMRITAEGFWLEEEKRFLITHTSNITPIVDYPIKAIALSTKTKENEKKDEPEIKHRQGRSKNDDNQHINTRENPSHTRGETKRQTDIVIDFDDFDIEIIDVINEKKAETLFNVDNEKNDKKNNSESSADRHGSRSNRPRKSENTEKNLKKSEIDDLALIFSALEKMKKQQSSSLKDVHCIDRFGNNLNHYSLLQIQSLVKPTVHPSWINPESGRFLMFLKIKLTNFDDHLYLIDINKNKNKEAYCAFLFTTKEALANQDIIKICKAIEEKKGVKKWLENEKLKLNQKKAINHTNTNQADWIKSFNSVFKHLLTKKKF